MAKRTNRMVWGLIAILAVVLARPMVGVEASDDWGRTPLMLAAIKGDAPAVRALLAQGAAVNGRDQNGMTALMWAAPQVVDLLLRAGANVNARDNSQRTALTYAAFEDDAAAVKALLDGGAEVDPRDSFGMTPLYWATQWLAVWLLVEAPNIVVCNPPHLDILPDLRRAHAGQERNRPAVVSLLLQRGANPNARDKSGSTPLIRYTGLQFPGFIQECRFQIVTALLANGADVNAQDSEGNTALMGASQRLDAEMVKLLLAHGAKVKRARHDGQTALSLASEAHREPGASGEERERVKALLIEAADADQAGKR